MGKKNGILVKIGIALMGIVLVSVFAAGGFYMLTGYRLDAVEVDTANIKEEHKEDQIYMDGWCAGLENDVKMIELDSVDMRGDIKNIVKYMEDYKSEYDQDKQDYKIDQREQRGIQQQILTEIRELKQ